MGAGHIIDVHAHGGVWGTHQLFGREISPFENELSNSEACRSYMQKNSIDYLVLLPYYTPEPEEAFAFNRVVQSIANELDRVYAGVWLSPNASTYSLNQQAFEYLNSAKTVCIKMAPNTWENWSSPDPATWSKGFEKRIFEIFGFARKHSLPIQFHTGSDQADPCSFDKMIREIGRDITFHFVHMGLGVGSHFRFVPRFIEWLEEEYPVYCDTALAADFALWWLLRLLHERGLGKHTSRIMFGTDYPWGDFASAAAKVYGLTSSYNCTEHIMGLNAYKLYIEGHRYDKGELDAEKRS